LLQQLAFAIPCLGELKLANRKQGGLRAESRLPGDAAALAAARSVDLQNGSYGYSIA
jgi:hypothetical protein